MYNNMSQMAMPSFGTHSTSYSCSSCSGGYSSSGYSNSSSYSGIEKTLYNTQELYSKPILNALEATVIENSSPKMEMKKA